MFRKTYLWVSGVLFGLVALLHFARLGWHLPIHIGSFAVPMWPSDAGVVVAAVLSLWAFSLIREKKELREKMLKDKLSIAGIVVAFALLTFVGSMVLGHDSFLGAYFMHLSAESVAIAATVGLIEYWNETKQRDTAVKKLCWETLYLIQRALWVWQGGRRDLDPSTLLGHLSQISNDDPFPNCTRALVMELGARTAQVLRLEPSITAWDPAIHQVLERMQILASLGNAPDVVPPTDVAKYLREAAIGLYQALGIAIPPPDMDTEWQRIPDEPAQQQRYFVVRGD